MSIFFLKWWLFSVRGTILHPALHTVHLYVFGRDRQEGMAVSRRRHVLSRKANLSVAEKHQSSTSGERRGGMLTFTAFIFGRQCWLIFRLFNFWHGNFHGLGTMGKRIFDVIIWHQTSNFDIRRQIWIEKSFLGHRVTYVQQYGFSLRFSSAFWWKDLYPYLHLLHKKWHIIFRVGW